ncbi:MAG: zinc ribbon domain-containing protein [Candidatus Omnitrophota bacterium]|nr:MAG: zinc ribbon domain-containing protein [Candidatus Omnitrophota bacterium]
MPTYEYVCNHCGFEFERFQSMKEEPIRDCPECKQSNSVQRLIGCGAGIIFKGSGFYETDYKKKSSSSSSTAEKRMSEAKSECKTDITAKKDTGGANGKVKTADSA